jgi:hypothetical protein
MSNTKHLLLIAAGVLLLAVLLTTSILTLNAQTNTDLAAEYAPVLKFTGGELFYPTSVDYVIESSTLKQRGTAGLYSTIISSTPTASNLGSFTGNDLFLDNNLGDLDAIAADYRSNCVSFGYPAYVHIQNSGQYKVIQYWFLYAYNNGPLNNHQGDWEVIQIFLDSSGNPEKALYSQHGSGENAPWADVEKQGNHPIVYVAQGSHANYFRSYQGKIGIENDIVASDGKTIQPEDLNLVLLGERGNFPADQSWLNFEGRWGYWDTEQEVALGSAGSLGPVFNQDGTRWAQPEYYLNSTLGVNGTYFLLALLAANFLAIFLAYTLIRAAWKGWGIAKLRKSGLLAPKIIKGRVAVGLLIGVAAIALSIAAFFVPWYNIAATSEAGPLANQGGTTLMTINGVNGLQLNLFMGEESSDSTSGFVNFASAQMPFAIIIAAGIILFGLDIIGLKSKNSLGNKLMFGIIGLLLPVIFVVAVIVMLPSLLPMAGGLIPGGQIPQQVSDLMNLVGANPIGGAATTVFPIIGSTTVTWGLGLGAYLFIIAAVLRVVGGIIVRTAPNPKAEKYPPPPPPPP